MAKDAPGMRGLRSRNQGGELRRKRGDTHIGTIEQQYGVELGARSDKHLENLLRERGVRSLNDLLNGSRDSEGEVNG